ncbi:hypothetical protein PanWU01x14_046670 [Parasponia andersonii]|uniref:Uncharacterized protein n=1 Tax=Parasponia andersonii TaxID=3476 RepID=A0A2P5DNT6_PARAD|nr:hypothetical protein PanWU01x14_046670 [Parasponia andersonii]
MYVVDLESLNCSVCKFRVLDFEIWRIRFKTKNISESNLTRSALSRACFTIELNCQVGRKKRGPTLVFRFDSFGYVG